MDVRWTQMMDREGYISPPGPMIKSSSASQHAKEQEKRRDEQRRSVGRRQGVGKETERAHHIVLCLARCNDVH